MRFLIKHSGCASSERIGVMAIKNQNIETPATALLTKGGSVANLTADVLSKVFTSPQLLWTPLSNCVQLEVGLKAQGMGLAHFAGLPGHFTCMATNDLNEVTPLGHFENDLVPLWTRNGKKKITADRYMDLIEVFKPDIILAIADVRTSLTEAHKRITKSVDRTCSMLDTCMKRYKASSELQGCAFIAVIVGASRPKEFENCIKRVLLHKDSLSGVALSGLSTDCEDSLKLTVEQLEPIFKKIDELLPKNLLRIIEGCWNPVITLSAIEHGWDLFDGSYPARITNSGFALKLNFDTDSNTEEMCVLDLNDARYKEEFKPILASCACLTCKKHTRAYINHLLNTREMLALVLLSIHNLHHFNEMFRLARQHIASNTFQPFKASITTQYQQYRAAQEEINKAKLNNEAFVKPEKTKKKRLLNENGYSGTVDT